MSVDQVAAPTFAVVSVKLLSVVLFPLDGLPTSAIRGSRGMILSGDECRGETWGGRRWLWMWCGVFVAN